MGASATQTLKLVIAGDGKGAEGSLKGIQGQLSTTAGKTAAVGAAMVVAGATINVALGGARNTAVGYGKEVINIQRLTGLSATESSKFAVVLGRVGITGGAVGTVVQKLSVAIAGHSKVLKDVGIATQNADGSNRDSMAVMADLAEYYSKATDKTKALTVVSSVLGKGYKSLIPVLAGGKAGIESVTKAAEKQGLILSQKSLDAVKKYTKAQGDLAQTTKGTAVQIGLATLPWETFKTKAVGDLAKQVNEIPEPLKSTSVAILSVSGDAFTATGALLGMSAAAVQVAEKFPAAGAAVMGVSAWTVALTGVATEQLIVATAIDKLKGKFGELGAAGRVLGPALGFMGPLLGPIAIYNKLVMDGTAHLFGLDKAGKTAGVGLRIVSGATIAARTPTDSLTTSTNNLAQATKNAGAAARTLAGDNMDQASKELAAMQAHQSVIDQTKALNDARKEGKTPAAQLRIMEQQLKVSTMEATRADDAAKKATDKSAGAKRNAATAAHNLANAEGSARSAANRWAAAALVARENTHKLASAWNNWHPSNKSVQFTINTIQHTTISASTQAAHQGHTGQHYVTGKGWVNNAIGSYIPPRKGGTLALMAEAGVGEFAIPANRAARSQALARAAMRATGADGGGGDIYNFNISGSARDALTIRAEIESVLNAKIAGATVRNSVGALT